MAHEAHNIPWNVLASNLQWFSASTSPDGLSNLYPRFRRDQGKELTSFVDAFVKNIDEHSTHERRKYPEKYDLLESEDVVLDDDIVQEIIPTVRGSRLRCNNTEEACSSEQFCQCKGDAELLIPHMERKASSFMDSCL